MTAITLEAVKARQDELEEMVAKLEEQWKQPNFFEYQGERIQINPGEIYVGTITTTGEYGSYHLILIPGEAESITWEKALQWTKEQGGELPNRTEGALLFATQKDEFKDAWYWTREPHTDSYAWVQVFNYGNQGSNRKGNYGRARAVRRLVIQ